MALRHHYIWLSDPATSWATGTWTDTATDQYNLITTATDLAYPSAVTADGFTYGRHSTAPAKSNHSDAQSGFDKRLAGRAAFSSSANYYTFQVSAGNLNVWLGAGSPTTGTNREGWALFDGVGSDIATTLGTTNVRFWTASTAHSSPIAVISKVDLSVWLLTGGSGGTSGTTEPSGAGPTFVDGDLTWTRQNLTVMAIVDGNKTASTNMVDQNGATVLFADWGASAPLSVSNTSGFVALLSMRHNSTNMRTWSWEPVATPLADVTLTDDTGATFAAAGAPSVYAKQPSGYRAWRINYTTGAAAFTLSGSLASYFTVDNVGGQYYITTNGTPIPDALAGAQTLTVTQTDGLAANSPYATAFNVTVVSSQGRPLADGSVLGAILTNSYVSRKTTLDAIASGRRAFWTNQPFARDNPVVGKAAFETEWAACVAANDGATWFRIRLQNGTYEGVWAGQTVDFGPNGGVLIEPDTGHDPAWNIALSTSSINGLHVRGLKCIGDKTKLGALSYAWRFGDPGPTGIGGGGRFNAFRFENCRFGIGHDPTLFASWTSGDQSPELGATGYVLASHGHTAEVVNCVFDASSGVLIDGVQYATLTDNVYRHWYRDFNSVGPQVALNSTLWGTCYANIARNKLWNGHDITGRTNNIHADFLQLSTPLGNMSFWFPDAGKDVNISNPSGTPWVVGEQCLRQDGGAGGTSFGRVYQVSAVTTGVTGASGPTGTTNGQVDGGVTWDYVGEYVGQEKLRIVFEDNTEQGKLLNSPSAPSPQFVIDSMGGFNVYVHLDAINNSDAGNIARGFQLALGEANYEFNTLAFPSQSVSSDAAYIQATDGIVRRRKNITAGVNTTVGSAVVSDYDNVRVDWLGTAVNPNRPQDILAGPPGGFTLQASPSQWSYPELADDGVDADAFFTQQRTFLRSLGGADRGAQPYTVAVASDTTPDAFSFTDVTDATLSTVYTSNIITVTGIDAPADLTLVGGEYSINGGGWATAATTVVNGDTVQLRNTSSGLYSTAVDATLTIGGVSDTYTITTEVEPPPQDPSTGQQRLNVSIKLGF